MGLVDAVMGQFSVTRLAFSLLLALFLRLAFLAFLQHQRIARLGKRAPKIDSCVPLAGLDIVVRGILAHKRHRIFQHWRDHYFRPGIWTVETSVVGRRVIFTADPENIKAILSSQFTEFGKGPAFHHEWKPFLGHGIFAVDGSPWQTSRSLLRPQFTRSRVGDLDCLEAHFQTLLTVMKRQGPIVDMSDLFLRYALDVTTDFLLGVGVDSLTSRHRAFATAFDEVQRIHTVWSRSFGLSRLIVFPRYRAHLRVLNDFVNDFVDRALGMTPDELEAVGGKDYTFLQELARVTRDREVIRDQIVNVILAGRDTTAGTLAWSIYELSKSPQTASRLRAEILKTMGPDRPPTPEDLKSMPYLRSIIDETLRLYPSVPFNLRRPLVDTTLPRGGGPDGSEPLPVLAGDVISYSPLVMQRRPDLYPAVSETFADPAVFSPERWQEWQPKSQDYIPFNAGPRVCLGQQFALTEMSYVLCRLFQRFARVESHMFAIDGGQPDIKTDITIRPGQGVHVAFYEDE